MEDDDALIGRAAVAQRYDVHPKSVDALVKSGRIPRPVPGWPGKRRWLKSEIVSHIRGLRSREMAEQVR